MLDPACSGCRTSAMHRLFASIVASLLLTVALAGCGAAARGGPTAAGPDGPRPAVDLLPREAAALQAAGIARAELTCNSRQMWNGQLRTEAKASATALLALVKGAGLTLSDAQAQALHKQMTEVVAWRMVLSSLVDGQMHNLGAVPLAGRTMPNGKPLVLFRSGFTAAPDRPGSCVDSLVAQGGVRHVVNLYAGAMPTEELAAAECKRVQAAGGTCWDARADGSDKANWREDLREGEAASAKREAMQSVARLIREEILQPGGKPAQGNVLLHCGGGMHRTGMVVGVIERCLNNAPMAEIEAGYKNHVAWRSPSDPGGFEAENLHFIAEFDCALLQ
jgi:hypothetical protein